MRARVVVLLAALVVLPRLASGSIVKYPTGGDTPMSIAVADFNRDGRNDLAVATYGSSTLSVMFAQPTGTYTYGTYPIGSSARAVVAGDFNRD